MKVEVGCKIFSEFWINCFANDSLSFIVSKEPSYRKIALMNWYNYFLTGSICWWRQLKISYDEEFFSYVDIIDYKPIQLTKDNYINEIKKFIDDNRVIKVKFDLYYLIPNSLNWHKNHYNHYILLSGYDDEKKTFYCFSDNIKGYEENEIPYDRFNQSILIDELNSAEEMLISKDIKSFSYSIDKVKYYADKNKYNISLLSYSNYWSCDFLKSTSEVFMETNKITGRQKANKLLFQDLYIDNFISENMLNKLNQYTEELYIKWEIIKSILIKEHLKELIPDYNKLNNLAWDALKLEYEMWDLISNNF